MIQCAVLGLPAGVGGPDFGENLEGELARALFAVPAVKGVAFGLGFGFAHGAGSQLNDSFAALAPGRAVTRTNHNGGVNGGITNGMPVVFSTAVKPTPSIYKEQDTVDVRTGEPKKLRIRGRHDPAIFHRARAVVDAAAAMALCDLMMGRFGYLWARKEGPCVTV